MILAIEAKKMVDNDIVSQLKNDIANAVQKAIKEKLYCCDVEISYHTHIEVKKQLISFLKEKGYKTFFTSCCSSSGNKELFINVSWSEAK